MSEKNYVPIPAKKLLIPGTEPIRTFDYVFRCPSSLIRDKLALIDEQYQQEIVDLCKTYDDVYGVRDMKGPERAKHFGANLDLAPRGLAFDRLQRAAERRRALRILQLGISPNGLTPEEKNLVASDVSEEFWQEQNIVEVEDLAEIFRAGVEARRPARRVDTDLADTEHAGDDGRSVGGDATDEAPAPSVPAGEAAS